MSNSKPRIEYIDFLKGYLLSCICLSHFGYLPSFIKYIIYPTGAIYVPTFFLLSGLLYKENKYSFFNNFFLSKLKSLFIPYLFLFFVFIVLDWNLYLKSDEIFIQIKNAIFYADGPPKASPLWFIIKLFEVNILYFFILNFFKNVYYRVFLVVICSIIGYVLYYLNIHPFLGFDIILSSMFFFGFGHLGKNRIVKSILLLQEKSGYFSVLIFILLFFISLLANSFNSYGVLSQNKINNYFLFNLAAIAGGISFIIISPFLCEKFKSNATFNSVLTFFKYLSLNALPILGTHAFIIIVVDQILKNLNFINPFQGFLLKIFSITILTYYLIVPFLYNKFYFIFGKEKPNSNIFINNS
jgi:acyltransferase